MIDAADGRLRDGGGTLVCSLEKEVVDRVLYGLVFDQCRDKGILFFERDLPGGLGLDLPEKRLALIPSRPEEVEKVRVL